MCSHSGWLSCSPVFLLCFIVIPAKFVLFCYRSNFCDPSGSTLPRVKNNNNKRTYLSSCLRTLTTWHCPHSPAAVAAYSSNRSISPASRAHSSKPASDRQTDRQTNRFTDRPSTVYYMQAVPIGRAFQFGQTSFDSIRFSLPNRFFRFHSIRQSDKFAAFTLIFK